MTDEVRHDLPPVRTRVEARPEEDHISVEIEDATVRDLYDRIAQLALDSEKRMGRMEKGLVALVIAVASPKVGGPDVLAPVQAALAEHFPLFFS